MSVRVLASVAVMATGALAACGTESPASEPIGQLDQPIATTLVPLPATTLLRPNPSNAAPITSLPLSEVSEPCPETDASVGGGPDMATEAGRLEPMLGQVLAYGSQRPDEFGGYGLVWHDDDNASVFVSFTGNLEEHRAAIASSVEFPDELIVCQVAISDELARTVEATLVEELAGRFVSIGRGGGAIEVTLAANEEELAGELRERYSDAINLTVGALAYPLAEATSVCDDPPAGTALPGLRIEVLPPPEPVNARDLGARRLTVTLTNTGSTPLQFISGTAIGTIVDSSGKVVSSSSMIALADVGIPVDLEPGASAELPLAVSTASCDPQLGYVVPAGDYRLIAAVQHSDGETTTLLSEPAPIVLAG